MNDAQKLAMRLSAAGDASAVDGKGIYLLRMEEDEDGAHDLVERHWTDFDATDAIVASGVRKTGSAPYLLAADDDRIVFYVDEANELRASMYDPDATGAKWTDADADGLAAAAVHERGQLSACALGDATLLFFQNPAGAILCLQETDGAWSPAGECVARAPAGTPHYPLAVDTRLYLFYAADQSLRCVAREAGEAAWKEHPLDMKTLGQPVSRFVVAYDPDKALLVAYVLAGGLLTSIDEKGRRTDLVRAKADGSGGFEPVTAAERAIHLHFHGNNNRFGNLNWLSRVVVGGGVVGHGRSRRWRRWH